MSVPPTDTKEDHRALIAILFTAGTFIVGTLGFFYNADYAKTIFTALLPVDAIFINSYFTKHDNGNKSSGP